MRRSLPTFRLNNVIRLCALAMAMCFLMTTQSVWGARPKFVTHTHGTLASPIAVCYNQSPYNLIPLLGTLDSQAGNVETYTLIDMTTSGAIDTFPAHATAAGVVGGVLSAIYLTTPIAYWYPGTAHGIDSFSIVVSDGLTSDTTKFVFNIIAPPVAYPVSGRTYVYVGDQVTLSAGGTGGSLYWRSSNTSLATVDLITGVVNGVSAGNVIIYDSVSSPTCGDSMLAHPMVVLSSTPPSITSVGASESAVPGTSITIAGANFNATPSLNTVTFGGVETRPTAGSTTSLTVTVPYGAMNSNVSVLDDSSRLVVYDKLAFTPLFDNVGFNPGTLLNFRSNFNIQLPNGTGALGPIYKPYDITSADLDGDGKPDLIVAGSGADAGGLYHVRVYRNITPAGYLDTPSFAPVQLFQVGAYPVNVKAADLDGDGKLELIVACTGSAVSILKNTSTGGTISFAAKVDKVAGAGPMELAIADFDGDGRPDIGVTSSGFVPLNIPSTFTVIQNKTYVGQAFNTSSFVSDTIFTFQPGASGDFPISICAGDFNHDGLIDVAFSNKYKRKITIFQNRSVGHNSFIFDTAGRVDFSVAQGSSGYPNQIKTADIDGDGKLDLLVANSDSDLTAAGTYNALSVLHNTSTGGTITSSCFAAKVDFTTGLGPVALSIGDLDGDGKKDVITSNVDSSSLSILKNTSTSGTISFASRSDSFIHNPYVIPADGGPIGSVIVDLDSNQVPDIAVVSREGNVLSIFKHFPIPDTNTITTATGGDSVCINATLGMVSAIVHPGHESEYWKVTNTGIATIDSATGVVTGVAAGTDTVKLAVISLRDTVWLTHVIKVKPLPNPGTISGTSAVCVGDSIVLTPSVGAGTWSSSNAHASVDAAAEVTGVSAGSSVISYTVTTPSCGDSSSTHGVTVNPLPDAGVITGFGGMCPSSTVSLSESVGGGTWSSTNTTLATVSGTGVVHSLTLTGVDTIRYVVTTATCGNDTAIKSISIINLGSHTPIVPNTRNVCVGLQVTLTNAASGGTWSSSASGTASVSPSGVVTGVASGVATISYIEAYTCFTDTSYATVTVNPLASAGVITGSTHVCVGLVSFDTVTGSVGTGTWLSTNTAIANVGSSTGDVHGVANGTDTIMHISTNTCNSDTARQTIIVSAAANPGTISGATNLCVDSTVALTLTGADAGGSWDVSAGSGAATVDGSGHVTGTSAGTVTVHYVVSSLCNTDSSSWTMTINPQAFRGAVIGFDTICNGATQTLTDPTAVSTSHVWSSSNTAIATVDPSTGAVTGGSTGSATITYIAITVCSRDTATRTIYTNPLPNPGVLSGAHTVCTGNTTTLTSTVGGGVWSSTSSAIATVNTTGGVTGVAVAGGVTVISYTAHTTACGDASDTFAMNVVPINPGVISGLASVCVGSHITLSETVSGGSWTSSNNSIATVATSTATTGQVTGVVGGTVTITYTITSACGSFDTTFSMVVDSLPVAGTITDANDSVCIGVPDAFSNSTSYNTGTTPWSIAAGGTGVATIDPSSGVLTGSFAGTVIVKYTASVICGSASTTKTIYVRPNPVAASVSGPLTACVGNILTFTATGGSSIGTWSSSVGSVASVDAITGSVTALATGSTNIVYTVSEICGTAPASSPLTVNNVPHINTITTPPAVFCVGNSVNLTATNPGSGAGSWIRSNTHVSIAPVLITLTTNATALLVGKDTITYTTSNACGTSDTSIVLTVSASPTVGPIVGTRQMCVGSTVTLTDTSTLGTWGVVPGGTSVVFVLATGALAGQTQGLSGGIGIIYYRETNICGTTSSYDTMTVYRQPVAGTVTGTDTICGGTSTTLVNTGSGSSTGDITFWFSSDTTVATVDSFSGVVHGANSGGIVDIFFADTNFCGTVYDTVGMLINQGIPNPGVIVGPNAACVGSSVSYTDTVTTGFWTSSNTAIATVSAGGSVTAVSAGVAVISYTVGNPCDTSRISQSFKSNAYPRLTSSHTPSVCDSQLFAYLATSDSSVTSWMWSRAVVPNIANIAATADTDAVDEYLDNQTNTVVMVKYNFTFTANSCTSNDSINVSVKPTPYLTSVPFDTVCSGSQLTYVETNSTGTGTGMTWVRNPGGTYVTTSPATGTGNIAQVLNDTVLVPTNATFTYTLNSAGCTNTALVTVTVDPRPGTPQITTHSPSTVCDQTFDQNFGANSVPPAGVIYTWVGTGGASVWATGGTKQYSLVNFNNPGYSTVYLLATLPGYTCASKDSFNVFVENTISDKPTVVYFNGDFVCLSNNQDTYQWGSDNIGTLDSDLFAGETNQNYRNDNPDFTHNYYWVMTSRSGCFQKSYYNAPTAVANITANMGDVKVYPNPANSYINVEISNTSGGEYTVDIVNMLGQKISTERMTGTKTTMDVAGLAAGCYFVDCYRDGIKFTTVKFIKN